MIVFTASPGAFPQQIRQTAPHWVDLPADTAASLGKEGINDEIYEGLLGGQLLTQSRPVPAGKSGVHVAVFGIIYGSIDRLWDLLDSCGRRPPIMPYVQSCRRVKPDHPLAPNKRWELLEIEYRMSLFCKKTTIVNEKTIAAPNYMGWRQIRGDAKFNEGYFRIITITPCIQLVVYNILMDPGALLPGFMKPLVVKNSMPAVIAALREHSDMAQKQSLSVGKVAHKDD